MFDGQSPSLEQLFLPLGSSPEGTQEEEAGADEPPPEIGVLVTPPEPGTPPVTEGLLATAVPPLLHGLVMAEVPPAVEALLATEAPPVEEAPAVGEIPVVAEAPPVEEATPVAEAPPVEEASPAPHTPPTQPPSAQALLEFRAVRPLPEQAPATRSTKNPIPILQSAAVLGMAGSTLGREHLNVNRRPANF